MHDYFVTSLFIFHGFDVRMLFKIKFGKSVYIYVGWERLSDDKSASKKHKEMKLTKEEKR